MWQIMNDIDCFACTRTSYPAFSLLILVSRTHTIPLKISPHISYSYSYHPFTSPRSSYSYSHLKKLKFFVLSIYHPKKVKKFLNSTNSHFLWQPGENFRIIMFFLKKIYHISSIISTNFRV